MGKLLPTRKKRSGRISRVLCAVSRAAVIHLHRPSPAGVKATYPRFGPALRRGRMSCPSLFGLAHDEVCLPRPLPDTWWALTPPFHPYHFWRYVFCGTLCPRRALTSLSVPTCPGCCPASRPIEPGLSSAWSGVLCRIAPRRRRPLLKKPYMDPRPHSSGSSEKSSLGKAAFRPDPFRTGNSFSPSSLSP
jgi:hypothetical protein